ESSCTNSVFKEEANYVILSHLGHMEGSSEIKSIKNPRNLPKAKKHEINKRKDGAALGYSDKSRASKQLLDFRGLQLFSTFTYKDKRLYLVHLNGLTFLAEIVENDVQAVHPFFNNKIYTHDPITRNYGKYILINMTYYGTALNKEVAIVIINEDSIVKLDWNEDHSR
ncbi:MAG: hypothetical protein RIF46_02710, partial [Cyclobacteriaceae bacterium]